MHSPERIHSVFHLSYHLLPKWLSSRVTVRCVDIPISVGYHLFIDSLFEAEPEGGDSPKDAGGTPDFIKKFYKDLKNSSNAKQLTVGAISGWAAGYVASKFGKIAATALGGSFLLIQVTTVSSYDSQVGSLHKILCQIIL